MSRRRIPIRIGSMLFLAVLTLGLLEAIGARVLAYSWELGPTLPIVQSDAVAAVLSLAVLGLLVVVMRVEGVGLTEIGLDLRLAMPALVTVACYFLAVNVAGAAFAIGGGAPESIGYHWTVPLGEAVVIFLWMLVIAGLLEELLFRGYIQTKCIAIIGDRSWIRIGTGVVLAGLLFSAYHIPRIVTDGAPGGMSSSEYLALLAVNGVAFGLLYEWTHNLYIPILVHAAGNMPGTAGILFFSTAGWASWAFIGYQLVSIILVIAMILGYRRMACRSDWMPVWTARYLTTDSRLRLSQSSRCDSN